MTVQQDGRIPVRWTTEFALWSPSLVAEWTALSFHNYFDRVASTDGSVPKSG
jgi:hypothetical protein